MGEDLTPPNAILPEEQPGVLPEQQLAAELVEAQAAVADGTATHEQQLAVSSFEVGAEHGQDTAINELAQRTVEERTITDSPDWLESTEATIAAWPAVDTARRPFGEPKKKSDRELHGYEDIRDYLLRSRTEAEAAPDEDTHYDETMGKTLQDMTEKQLVKKWAQAEDMGNRTVSTDIQDEIQTRLVAKRGSEDKKLEHIDKLHRDMTKLRKEIKVEDATEDLAEEIQIDKVKDAKPEAVQTEGAIDQEPVEKLELGNAKLGNVDKTIAQRAKEVVELEKKYAHDAKGFRGFMKKIATGVKYSALFAQEAERGIGLRLKADVLSEVEANDGSITPNRFLEVLGYEVNDLDVASRAILTAMTDEIFQRDGDSVITVDGIRHEDDNPIQVELSLDAKVITHEFIEAVSQPGLSQEEIATIKEKYGLILDARFGKFRSENQNYGTGDLEVATSNATKILESCMAVLGHDNGREKVRSMIDQMIVKIGNINYGSNNNLETKYLETTAAKMKARNTASVLVKSSIVAASWAGSGAAGTWATQQLSTKGAKVLGASLGGALLGPAGAILGIGAGAAVSAVYARHLGRKRANESVNLASIAIGEAGSRDDNEILRDLAPSTLSFTETTDTLQSFMTRKSEEGEWQLKSDLTNEQIILAMTLIADTGNRLAIEAHSNVGNVSLNLFESTDKASFNSERISMIKAQKALESLLSSEFGGKTIEIPTTRNGESTTQEVDFDQVFAGQIITSELTIQNGLAETKAAIDTYINQQGRKAAKFGGGLAAAAAVLSAVGFEVATRGNARTLIDNFHAQSAVGTGTSETISSTSTSRVGIAQVLERNGGTRQNITEYLNNDTPGRSDGTELGMNFHTDSAGGIIIDQNPGIAGGNGVSVNLMESAKEGNLFAYLDASDGTSVKVPLNVVDGKIEAVIPKGSALHDLFTPKDGKWHFLGKSLHTGVATGENTNMSIAAVLGENSDGINITETTQQIVQNVPAASPPQGVFPLTGVVPPPGPKSIFSTRQGEENAEPIASEQSEIFNDQNSNENIDEAESNQDISNPVQTNNPTVAQPVVDLQQPVQAQAQSPVEEDESETTATESSTKGRVKMAAAAPRKPRSESAETSGDTTPKNVEIDPNTVQSKPLSPGQILERLASPNSNGLVFSIDGSKYKLLGSTGNGYQLEVIGADDAAKYISINKTDLRQAIEADKFRANDFLGTNNAEEIVSDLKDGEEFYDKDLKKHVKVSRDPDDKSKFIFVEVEKTNRDPEPNKPYEIPLQSFIYRLTNGALSPSASRGVQLA